ncbi:hypothetical protein T281_02805 [Rhodomicrobium udaipurense JA643]|uniref:Uncharacterized protein n=1 Tax=Rhodomicrobium udaipurense TaxID=1202716 RepID=A0A8I1KGL4_9HYPH|nr:hypothetical protein [Rhodomicrobium udaipurense]KAI95915.1 hypothetical protein T281_02805 [Rhodomicrobium udaipurense JA643]MBJ7542860.1 hypothetical protein [Rhodomicrobium udaipurense]
MNISSGAVLFLGVATFFVAYSQMKIASAKARLDLYNRRFAIYICALEYYLILSNDASEAEIKEKSISFTKASRESIFLFDPIDGIGQTMHDIMQDGSIIRSYMRADKDYDSGKRRDDTSVLHQASIKAREDFEKKLGLLERQIDKYIEFRNIEGWTFLSFGEGTRLQTRRSAGCARSI